MPKLMGILVVLVAAFALMGCGNKSGTETSADAKVEMAPMDELKSIATDLDAQTSALMKPINDVQVVVDKVTSMPARLGVDAKALKAMASAALQNGSVQVSADFSADQAVKAEVEALLKDINGIGAGLKAVPENVKVLARKVAAAVVQLPVLATKITTTAQAKIANPLASAETKASAQAELSAVAGVQAEIQGKIQEVQSSVTSIPALATEALAKLTTSFAVGG